MSFWQQLARTNSGPDYAAQYAARFRELAAAQGDGIHGEASLVASLVAPPARVLDAGCGTGRVAIRLHELGYETVGVDLDPTMLREARADAPDLDWRVGDLATLDTGETYDVVLLAGNIVPTLDPGTLAAAAQRLAAHAADGGRIVLGYGLDVGHLPPGCPEVPLSDVETAFGAAGFEAAERWSGWDRAAYADGDGYAVLILTRC